MIEGRGIPNRLDTPLVGRLSKQEDASLERFSSVLITECRRPPANFDKHVAFITDMSRAEWLKQGGDLNRPGVFSVDKLCQFKHGDGLALTPEGKVLLVYRPQSNSNVLFVTSQCNSNCVMCSQPPEDDGLGVVDLAFKTLDLIDPEIEYLGITGGEPTLLQDRLFQFIEQVKGRLPLAALQVLTNARYFAHTENAQKLASVGHPKIAMCIPLCSDNPYDHDEVTGVPGSFAQTVKGMINLGAFGIPVELRIVMIKQTVSRLKKLAEFICRNMPFTTQVCFMGLEPVGRARENFSSVWIDPADYQNALEEAIYCLTLRGIPAVVYNEQLCVLHRRLWKYSRQAISDWKNTYLDTCRGCTVLPKCGGFFSSCNTGFHSRSIARIFDGV